MGPGTKQQRRSRPSFDRVSSPAFSSTRRCFEIAGRDMSNGWANSVTDDSPRARRVRIARRVGSASAANVVSRLRSEYLTIWLSIAGRSPAVKHEMHGASRPSVSQAPGSPRAGNPRGSLDRRGWRLTRVSAVAMVRARGNSRSGQGCAGAPRIARGRGPGAGVRLARPLHGTTSEWRTPGTGGTTDGGDPGRSLRPFAHACTPSGR